MNLLVNLIDYDTGKNASQPDGSVMYSGSCTCFINIIITMIILPPNTSHISTNQSIPLFVIVGTGIPAQFHLLGDDNLLTI